MISSLLKPTSIGWEDPPALFFSKIPPASRISDSGILHSALCPMPALRTILRSVSLGILNENSPLLSVFPSKSCVPSLSKTRTWAPVASLPPLNLLSVNTVSPSTHANMITLWAKTGKLVEIIRIDAKKRISKYMVLLCRFSIDTSQKFRFYPMQKCHTK